MLKMLGSIALGGSKMTIYHNWEYVTKRYLQKFDIFIFGDFQGVQSPYLGHFWQKMAKFELRTPGKPKK